KKGAPKTFLRCAPMACDRVSADLRQQSEYIIFKCILESSADNRQRSLTWHIKRARSAMSFWVQPFSKKAGGVWGRAPEKIHNFFSFF
ncbi:MAG: hypothetical protein SO073_01480, partial [Candidatus Onthomonas sp.]|nr:hypothetical protein [Candidatus Onthomonas sp.]